VRRRPPNLLGEHNDAVLGGLLNVPARERKRLAAAGVIGRSFRPST